MQVDILTLIVGIIDIIGPIALYKGMHLSCLNIHIFYYDVVYQNYQYTRILLPVWYKDVNKAQYSIWRPTQKVRHLHSKYQSKCSMISLKWLAPYFRRFNSLPKLSNNILFDYWVEMRNIIHFSQKLGRNNFTYNLPLGYF